jgi:hypothetical protein
MRIERSVAAFVLTISILGALLTAATVNASIDRQATREYASTHGVVADLVITSGASPDVFYDL